MGNTRGSRSAVPLRTVAVALLALGPVSALTACSAASPTGAEFTLADSPASGTAEPSLAQSSTAPPASQTPTASTPLPVAEATAGDGSRPVATPTATKNSVEASASPRRTKKPATSAARTTKQPGSTSSAGTALRSVARPTKGDAAVLTLGSGTPSAAEAEVVRLVNLDRVAEGCEPLSVNPLLVQVARAHSEEMSQPGGFRHNSPDGRTPFQRLKAAGYPYSIATENIAAGQPNASAVFAAWESDEESRSNMLDCRLTQIGVGVVNKPGSQYVTYWTQNLATPM
jgi:uncharacterized protein YkwD